jgi:HemY protein
MARFILFLVLLVPLVVAGNWLLANPGDVAIHWLGYQIELHIAVAVTLVVGICTIVTLMALLLWQIISWPQRRRARRRYRTLARGLNQLTHGVTALALGDEKAAAIALKKASAALPDQPLPRLLTAQLLQRQGDHDAARTHLRALLNHESTALLASKRLIEQHSARQEWEAALALAEQLHSDSPREHWLVVCLIDLYARLGNARGMLSFSEGFQWQSPLSKEERNHFAARAYYLQSQTAENERTKRHALRHAVGYDPSFLPALIDYATLLTDAGEKRQARKWLLGAWLAQAKTLLIRPILRTLQEESARSQVRLLKSFLVAGNRHEHFLLRAEQALMAGESEAAETALEEALAIEESRLACTLMADVEKQLRGDEAANRWLARAMRAPASEAWICQQCGHAHEGWQAHCDQCHAFDSITFTRPESRITSMELATV